MVWGQENEHGGARYSLAKSQRAMVIPLLEKRLLPVMSEVSNISRRV